MSVNQLLPIKNIFEICSYFCTIGEKQITLMKKYLLVTMAMLFSCATFAQKKYTKTRKYTYKFVLEKPVTSSDLKFSDETLQFEFSPHGKGVDFKIKNLTSEIIKVKWDEVALIVSGDTKKTIHKGVKLASKTELQPMGIIIPDAGIDDFVWPAENVVLSPYRGWEVQDMLPSTNYGRFADEEKIRASLGQKIGLYFPVLKGEKQFDYMFEFAISEVIPNR